MFLPRYLQTHTANCFINITTQMSSRHLKIIVWKTSSCFSSSPSTSSQKKNNLDFSLLQVKWPHVIPDSSLIPRVQCQKYPLPPQPSKYQISVKSDNLLTSSTANILIQSLLFLPWVISVASQTGFTISKLAPI